MKYFYLCLALFALSLITACSDDEVIPEITPDLESEIYFIDAMNFSSEKGTSTLKFSTNKDWTISLSNTINSTQWCYLSQTNGQAGDISVEIRVDANEGYDDRNVVITIQAGKLSKTIMVTQKQKDALTLTTDRFEVEQKGGLINVEVKANISYEVIIPNEYKDWITPKSTGRGLTNSNLSFCIAENESVYKREGEIIITNGTLSERIKIYQKGEDKIILLSQNEYHIASGGQKIQVEVSSNFDFDIKMPEVDWVHIVQSRSISSHTLYFHIDTNPEYNQRFAEIIFYDKIEKQSTDTLKIIQENAQGIYFPTEEMARHEVSSTTKMLTVTVHSTYDNMNVWIPEQGTWIQLINQTSKIISETVIEYEYTFYLEENTNVVERTINV